MRAPEPIPGLRIVAAPAALDAAAWPAGVLAVRLAADDLFAAGATTTDVADALVEDELGFVGWWLSAAELATVLEHVDWPMPASFPGLAQGLVAGVPAKLWLAGGRALLVCAVAYTHELQERLP